MSRITAEDFAMWTRNPVTLAILELFHSDIQARKDRMGAGATLCMGVNDTAILTARAVGEIAGLSAFTGLQASDLGIEDGQPSEDSEYA